MYILGLASEMPELDTQISTSLVQRGELFLQGIGSLSISPGGDAWLQSSFLLHYRWPEASSWYDITMGVAGTIFFAQEICTELFFLFKMQSRILAHFTYPRGAWVLSRFSLVWLCDPMDCSLLGSSEGFTRQEYWSGLPCPPPGIFSTQVSNSRFLCLLHWWFFTIRTT